MTPNEMDAIHGFPELVKFVNAMRTLSRVLNDVPECYGVQVSLNLALSQLPDQEYLDNLVKKIKEDEHV